MTAVRLNRILLVLGFLGLFVAGLLSLEKAMNLALPCTAGGGCAKVANDASGMWIGVPVAYYGLVGYLTLTALAVMRALNGVSTSRTLIVFGTIVSGIGAIASVHLQIVALWVLKATCPWCIMSALVMFATFGLHLALLKATRPVNGVGAESDPRADRAYGPSKLDGLIAIVGMVVVMLGLAVAPSLLKGDIGRVSELAADRERLLIPAKPNAIGMSSAPLTIVEFSDICCPTCQRFTPKVHDLVDLYPGRLRVIYRHFPIAQLHKTAPLGAAVSELAAEKGKFWPFLLAVMSLGKAQDTTYEDYVNVARNVGMDPETISVRLQQDGDPVFDRVTADVNAAMELGVKGTPTFFLVAKGLPTKVTDAQGLLPLLEQDPYKSLLKNVKS